MCQEKTCKSAIISHLDTEKKHRRFTFHGNSMGFRAWRPSLPPWALRSAPATAGPFLQTSRKWRSDRVMAFLSLVKAYKKWGDGSWKLRKNWKNDSTGGWTKPIEYTQWQRFVVWKVSPSWHHQCWTWLAGQRASITIDAPVLQLYHWGQYPMHKWLMYQWWWGDEPPCRPGGF